jgi:5'-3' exoribonuclease 1
MEKELQARGGASQKKPKGGQLVISSLQRDLWKNKIRPYVSKRSDQPLDLGADLKAADRKFVQDLADSMHLDWSTREDDEGHRHLIVSFPPKANTDDNDDEEDEDEEGNLAAYRVMKTYDKATVMDLTAEDAQKNYEKLYQDKYQGWKTKYYLQKFEEWPAEKFDEELKSLCENYVQGLQWVLYYYYRGIASWPWFYRYHYAPQISGMFSSCAFPDSSHFLTCCRRDQGSSRRPQLQERTALPPL